MGGDGVKGAPPYLAGKSMIVNGEHRDFTEFTDAMALGDGVFETMRSYNGKVFGLVEHLARLQLGLSDLGISQFEIEKIREGVFEILRSETLETGALRISVYSDGTWIISHKKYTPPKGELVCSTKEVPGRAASYKSASYGERMALRRQALSSGFDDVILFDTNGEIRELSTSNLILRISGQWQTPRLEDRALPGITRKILMENFGVLEERLMLEDLGAADSLAAISSLREVQGIKAIDGKDFPISHELRELQESFHHWILGNLAL